MTRAWDEPRERVLVEHTATTAVLVAFIVVAIALMAGAL